MRVFPLEKKKKIAIQGLTQTFRILISLSYHSTTPPARQKFEKFKYIN